MRTPAALAAAAIVAALLPLGAVAADLRIGFNAELTSLDPHVHQPQNRNVLLHVYEALVRQDAQLRSVPGLAAEWRSSGPTTWVFKLRPNVAFQDGQALEAADVKASIDRARAPRGLRTLQVYLRDVEAVTVIDPSTVEVRTRTPTPTVPDSLSLVPIVPRAFATATEEEFGQGKVPGTGPYRLQEFARGQRVQLVRNERYWGPKPAWEHVSFEFMTREAARTSALLSGTVDVVNGIGPAALDALDRHGRIAHADTVSYMLNYLSLDQRPTTPFATDAQGATLPANPLRQAKVREAVSTLVNRELIVRRVMRGYAVPAAQLVPSGFFGFDTGLQPPAPDIARARALLAEAGYPQGFGLTLHCPNDRYLHDAKVCEAIAQMLTQAGIRTQVQALPFAVLLPWVGNPPKDKPAISMALLGVGAAFGDSLQPLTLLAHTHDAETGSGTNNWGRFSLPALDELIDRANQSLSAEREPLQRQAARMLAAGHHVIPVHHLKAVYAFRKGLRVEPRSDGFVYAADVRESEASSR